MPAKRRAGRRPAGPAAAQAAAASLGTGRLSVSHRALTTLLLLLPVPEDRRSHYKTSIHHDKHAFTARHEAAARGARRGTGSKASRHCQWHPFLPCFHPTATACRTKYWDALHASDHLDRSFNTMHACMSEGMMGPIVWVEGERPPGERSCSPPADTNHA